MNDLNSDVLNYGLPETSADERWYIRPASYDRTVRYLHLQRKTWYGWRSVYSEYIINANIERLGFKRAVQIEADRIVNAKTKILPTGEVR